MTVTSITPTTLVGCTASPATLTGTAFDTAPGGTLNVVFRTTSGALVFGGGSSDRAPATALVSSVTTASVTIPPVNLCGLGSVTVAVDVYLESGAIVPGSGSLSLTLSPPSVSSISASPFPAAIPTAFTVTGTGFGPVGGPATIRFNADGGALLFKDGTEVYSDVQGVVASATTITGVTPVATVCGPATVGTSVQVRFPDGCCTPVTLPNFAQFAAPTVAGFSTTTLPAAVSLPAFVVNGTGFGQNGAVANVRFVADGGASLFQTFVASTIDVPGVVGGGGTTITLQSPLAAVCGVPSAGASVRVTVPYGSSCVTTAPSSLQFVAPTITGAPSVNPVPGSQPTIVDFPGTSLGAVGAPVIVRFFADGGQLLFDDGTAATTDVPGVVQSATAVRLTTPLVTVCGAANRTAGVRIFAPFGGACVDSGPGYIQFSAPTLAAGGFSPSAVSAAVSTAYSITGTGFGPVGSEVMVRFIADSGSPFGNSTLSAVDTLGFVQNATTIVGTTPAMAACGGGGTAAVRVTMSDGSCVQSAAGYVTFTAPSVTAPTAGSPQVIASSNPPASITITGTGFSPVGGTAKVVFLSDASGPPLFGDGTAFESAAVAGTITSSTQITVRPPHATVCGVASRLASLRVELPGGSCALSVANSVRFDAPVVSGIGAVPSGPFLAGVPTPFQITGTGFGPVGSEALVRFRASSGAPFANGTAQEFDVSGTVASNTTITGTTPLVAMCGVASVTASFRVSMQDGSCADSAAAAISWTGSSITNVGGATPFDVPAAVPTTITINGTGFGPVGGAVSIVFVSDPAGPSLFGDGTLIESAPVQGTIASSTTITVKTPDATVCEATSRLASIRVSLPGGACAVSASNALRFNAPTISSLSGSPFVGSVSSAFAVVGTNFGPAGSPATVRFIASSGTPFANGSSSFFDVFGTVNATGTQVTGNTVLTSICGFSSVTASVRVILQDGTCADSAAGVATFNGPTITNVNGASPAVISATNPVTLTVNGTGFSPVGGVAQVVFISDPAGPPLFGDGTMRESAPVQGSITGATTITALPPNVTVSNSSNRLASVRVTLPGGSCATSAAGAIRFDAPSITGITASPGPTFPSAIPTAFTINGTNFAPVGSEVLVRFVADGGATLFGNASLAAFEVPGTVGAGGTQITGFTPLAAICPGGTAGAAIRLTFQDGTQVQTAATFLTFTGPTITTFSPVTFDGSNPASTFTVTGTGFGPVGSNVNVRFAATGGARPFGAGTLPDVMVLGTVVSATSITGTLPLATVCGASSVTATATVNLQGGSCASTAAGAITMNAPTFAVSTPLAPTSVSSTVSSAFTINGAGFGPVGQLAFVTFTATSGSPFGNGTLVETTVTGTIASATTITGFTPLAAACTGNVTATVSVRLPNGSCTPAAGAPTMTFTGPTITGTTPATVATPGLTPLAFTLSGTGFAPVGPVVVRFISADPVFGDGSQTTYDAIGTVVNSTTISVTTPQARICTASNTATASVRVVLSNGSCADSAGAIVTFNAPIPGSVTGLPPIPTLNPGPITIVGSNYPPIGTPVETIFTAVSGTPFASGTSREGRTIGFVNPVGQLVVTPPLADVCPPLTVLAASITLNFGSSRCVTSVPGTVTFKAPAFAPLAVSTPANQPAAITITGNDFPVVGTMVTVGFTDTSATGTAFDNASQKRTTVAGSVTAVNTITVPNPPRPAACPSNVVSSVDVIFGEWSCDYPVGGTVTFLAPTLTTTSTPTIPTLTPAALTLTGTNFGPTGVQVVVRWQSADLIFADGEMAAIDQPGVVTSNTTVTTTAPLARICPGTTSTATIRLVFPQGSCCDSPAAFETFPGPSITVTTPTVAALNPGSLTVTGTNFPPVGTPVTARLVVTGTPNNARVFASGTASETFVYGLVGPANSVSLSLPVGSVCPPDTSVTVAARVTFASGSCAEALAATLTYNAPTITSIGAVSRDATEPSSTGGVATPFVINGTNFPPLGSQVSVRFTAPAGYPQLFGNASLTQSVVGTVTALTSITVRPPAAALCEAATAVPTLDVLFENDPCLYSVPGTFTYQAPSITTVAPSTVAALTPQTFTLTGLRFGPTVPANTQVTVRWTSTQPIFGDGSLTSVDLPGTINSATQITTVGPLARVCAGTTADASLRVIFPMGACATTGSGSAGGGVTFSGATITALGATVPALLPGSVTIVGSNFPPVGTPISVTLTAPAGKLPFASGTKNQSTIVTQVSPANSISVVLPIGDVALADSPMAMSVGLDIGNSTCPSAAAGTVSYVAPAIVTIGAPLTKDATAPTSMSVTGANFPAVGSTAEVRFTSTLPIFGNTSMTQTVVGTVTGAGTLTVTPPAAATCEIATATATLDVRFLGNSLFYGVPGSVQYVAPTITSVVPAAIAAMTATPITINGTRFGPTTPPTTQVTVRWTSASTIFGDGTLTSVDLPGTITGTGTITSVTPAAFLCPGGSATATFRVIFAMGACVDAPAGTVTFSAPAITAGLSGNFDALNPGTTLITGTGFPAVGTSVAVTLTAPAGKLPFGSGTQNQYTVVTQVSPANTISVPLPIGDVAVADSPMTITASINFASSSCPNTSVGTIGYVAPAIATIGAPLLRNATAPAAVSVTGTSFPAVGSTAEVRFTATLPIFGGTTETQTVTGTVTGAGTLTVTPPAAATCEIATADATLSVRFMGNSLFYAVPGTLQYQAPAVSSISATTVNILTPQAETITGVRFGPTTSPTTQVTVRWTSASPIFGDGTLFSIDQPGTITATTTITTNAPLARVCAGASATATFRLIFASGACCDSGATAVTFNGPTVSTPASGTQNAQNPGTVTVTLSTPPPNGTPIGVTLTAAGGAPIFAAGTQSQAQVTATVAAGVISIPLPIADLCTPGSTNVVAVGLDIGNSTCASVTGGSVTYSAPTFTSIGAVTATAGAPPASLSITGSNLPPDGAPVTVRFIATAPATPFAGGTQAQAEVAGVVSGGGTTISVIPPTGTLCETASAATSLQVVLRNGPCSYAVGGSLTYNRASLGAATFSTNPIPASNPPAETLSGITNGPNYTAATAVSVRVTAATPIFADGTSNTEDVAGSAAIGGGSVTFTPPMGKVCTGTVAATVRVLYPDDSCSTTATLTYTAPTVTGLVSATVDAVAPAAITINGTNLPPSATVTVRFIATVGTPFEGGTSTQAEASGFVNAGGTAILVPNVPGATACGVASVLATLDVLLDNGCTLAVPTALTYTPPTVTTIAPATTHARSTGGTFTITGANFSAAPVGTVVTVKFSSASNLFADGTSTEFEETGSVSAANTVSTQVPDATICGAASATASVTIYFENGTCATAANVLTYTAPQVAGAGATGFTPQNLSTNGQTPFTFISTAGNNDFTGLVGQSVDVEFSIATGTPFQGGTASFDVVPGTVSTATTVTGSAPIVYFTGTTLPNVNVRVRFEDGTCTDLADTAYLKGNNVLAVAGSGDLVYLIDTSTNTQYSFSPISVPGAGSLASVAIDEEFLRVYAGRSAGTVREVEIGDVTTAGNQNATLVAATYSSSGSNGVGVVADKKNHRLWFVDPADDLITVFNERGNFVEAVINGPAGAVMAGTIYWDSEHDRMLVPASSPSQLLVYDATLSGSVGTVIPIPNIGTAVWTQGLALDIDRDRLYLTYDDPTTGNLDYVEERNADDFSSISSYSAIDLDPTAVMASDPETDHLFVYSQYVVAGTPQVDTFDENSISTGPVGGGSFAVGTGPTYMVINSGRHFGYVSNTGSGDITVFNTQTFATSTISGITGAGFSATTSP